ncbi:hypothetical protein [Halorarum salinum]|uniref:Uncharacterized protein n=1 Tax=Halorarum salinum TaxID=2743089 RepID=A0A7D5QF41_9EURY|nr:hypothetical protein [Halobaculum salinum]QLG63201.1 hypothetical protein HUG12_16260 [Halobaculum salinum]
MSWTISNRLQYGAVVAALAVLGTSLAYSQLVATGNATEAAMLTAYWVVAFTIVSWLAVRNLGVDEPVTAEGGDEA